MKTNKKNYFAEIEKALISYENFKPYHPKSIMWICNRIEWCWKFKHITEDQKNNLIERICEVMKTECRGYKH